METMASNGGMILEPSLYIEDNIPVGNILALYDTAKNTENIQLESDS